MSYRNAGRTTGALALFRDWFQKRGWKIYPHQLDMLKAMEEDRSVLLIAPTGGGKTLAGFLPTLLSLAETPFQGIHTLYLSPLKALAADVERNLMAPIKELKLSISVEIRTGDTSSSRKRRQFLKPPNILLTTPESLELLLSYPDAETLLGTVKRVVIDEVHAMAPGKRGHLASLCLARLWHFAPNMRLTGLSATVAEPEKLAAWLGDAEIIRASEGPLPEIEILETTKHIPWSGYMGTYAVDDIYAAIQKAQSTIVFVNTRAQAEWLFQQLWKKNFDDLPIALHHGSLERDHRQKVELKMAEGSLRAIVATASLDLGIDWGAVDLVIQVGAPKGISRLLQRIGRSNHRYNKPSAALLIPTNRFETLECVAFLKAIKDGERDGEPLHAGSLDVLAQFVMNCACAGPFRTDELFEMLRRAPPYSDLTRQDFDAVVACVATGGYALRAYERFQRITLGDDGFWIVTPYAVRRHRMNSGTIVEYDTLRVGLRRKKSAFLRDLGRVEEFFIQGLTPGDTFLFAGQLVRYISIREDRVEVEKATGDRPKIPSFMGGRLPLSLALATRVQQLMVDENSWDLLPGPTAEWLEIQKERSQLPRPGILLVETFPFERKSYSVLYTFAGRNANQTLGLLLTLVMEEAGLFPLGFVASDYGLALWSIKDMDDAEMLLSDALRDKAVDSWVERSQMSKRAFRDVAIIAGLVERNHPGKRKTGKQVTISTDLIYEVLMRHEPDHILLKATRADVRNKIADTGRLRTQLEPLEVRHARLERPSPLAIPLLLEIGRERIKGKGERELLSQNQLDAAREDEGDRLLKQAQNGGREKSEVQKSELQKSHAKKPDTQRRRGQRSGA